jgi:malonyl-CoA O-methyltransferase
MVDASTRIEPDAARYDAHAVLEREVAARLLERVEFVRTEPGRLIDLGCGTGWATSRLKARFRKSQVIGLDLSPAMLRQCRKRSTLLRPIRAVCGRLSALPVPDRSADLLFSNMVLHFCDDPATLFSEFRRVLRPGGMLLFSTAGPDSLQELGDVWPVDASDGPRRFADMHEIGDALLSAGFMEPVTDSEIINLTYPDIETLLHELECTGASALLGGRAHEPEMTEGARRASAESLARGERKLTWEIVYGTAFGPKDGQPIKTPQGDLATFSVESLRATGLRGKNQDRE